MNTAAASQEPNVAGSNARKRATYRWLAWIAREPLFHFIVLGLLIWAGVEYRSADPKRFVIEVGPAERARLAEAYVQQFGQTPSPQQLESLIDRYILEEIYWREGLALKLDQGDEIVRRRVVQKYEFLQTDLTVTNTPTEDDLQRWFRHNTARYITPERCTFSHVYFSIDHDGEAAALDRAVDVLQKLRASGVSRGFELGDPFPGPADLSALTADEVGRLFGQSQLAEELFKLPTGQWTGPYRSGYGWHLVYITAHAPAASPAFSQVRQRVLADYQDEQRRLLNTRIFERLKAKYSVRYDAAPR